MARRFWALLLTSVLSACAAFNVELLARFGTGEAGALRVIDQLLPIAAPVWTWLERRAPNYRLGLSSQ